MEEDRRLITEYYDDVSMRWIDLENEDYSVSFDTAGGIYRFRFFVDNSEMPSNLYSADTDAKWLTLQRRERELWIYVDTNHENFERNAVIAFTHPKSRACDIELSVTQKRDIYDIRFNGEGKEMDGGSFISEGISVTSEFDVPLLVRGGRRDFRVFVVKESAHYNDDNALEGWYPVDNDRSVEIVRTEFFGEVISDYTVESETGSEVEEETGEESVEGLTYDEYHVRIRCYGPTDTDDYTNYRYRLMATHSDDPANIKCEYIVSYTRSEPAPGGITNTPSFIGGKTVDWDNIVFDKKEKMEPIDVQPINLEQQEGEGKIVYKLEYADTSQPIEIVLNDIQTMVEVPFIVSPPISTILTYQSSDFLTFSVVNDEQTEGKRIVRIMRNDDTEGRDFPHRRSCKLRFSLSEYPTLYKEMYITVSFPYIEPYTVYGIPNEEGNVWIDGVKVDRQETEPIEIGEFKPGTEIKTKTSPG